MWLKESFSDLFTKPINQNLSQYMQIKNPIKIYKLISTPLRKMYPLKMNVSI